jgi:hypothetical protein
MPPTKTKTNSIKNIHVMAFCIWRLDNALLLDDVINYERSLSQKYCTTMYRVYKIMPENTGQTYGTVKDAAIESAARVC